MKKTGFILTVSLFIFSCANNKEELPMPINIDNGGGRTCNYLYKPCQTNY